MDEIRENINKFLYLFAESLDISDAQYEKARDRYLSIAKWLQRDDSKVAAANPDIFSQGSFSLGTMVRPFSGDEKFDIDLVSTIQVSKQNITQQTLKEAVGFEIKGYARHNSMKTPPEEGRRCWTLNYKDEIQFSMDTLPAIPDAESFRTLLEDKGLVADWTDHAIAITDNTHPGYYTITSDWLVSNPRGYAEWFKSRMKTRFDERRKFLSEAMVDASIDDVPEYKVKTPLQRAVQILKRHRDIMFADDPDDKPISIIITTLAGHAYNNESDMLDALLNIVEGMPRYITNGVGIAKVLNPVNPAENFADKWPDYPKREKNFRDWLDQVRFDFRKAFHTGNLNEAGDFLKPRVGERSVNEALKHFPGLTAPAASVGLVKSKTHTPSRFNVPHREPIRWKWNPKGNVAITGKVGRDGFRKEYFKSGEVLPKESSLTFYAKTNIGWPYKIYWQVVNTGHEARNNLRGGYYEGVIEKGKKKRNESTMYTGMHWVECFIVKGGECLARSGEFVVNIQ